MQRNIPSVKQILKYRASNFCNTIKSSDLVSKSQYLMRAISNNVEDTMHKYTVDTVAKVWNQHRGPPKDK